MKNAPGSAPSVSTSQPAWDWLGRAVKGLYGVFKRPRVAAANSREGVSQLGIVAAINRAEDNWLLLTPYGEHQHPVGLQVVDRKSAEECVRSFNSLSGRVGRLFRGLPIFVGHPDFLPNAELYPDKSVYGEINALEAREDGLYGRVKWTPEGKAMVNEGDFKFQSPHWGMIPVPGRRGVFRPVEIYSIGLTNSPNLPVPPLPAQNQAEQPTQTETIMKKKLAELLKLQAAANTAEVTDKQIEDAVEALLGQLAAANSKANTLEANVTAANDRATTAEAALAAANSRATTAEAARNEQLVTAAVNEGRITAADRAAWLGKLAGDFAANSKALAELKPAVNTQSQAKGLGDRKDEAAAPTTDPVRAINEAVSRHMKETGTPYDVAFAAVKAAQPALFEAKAA